MTDSKKRKSMEDLADDPKEAERILGYVNGKDIKGQKHQITDFASFKEAFRDAFMKEGTNSHARLWETIQGEEDILLKLYGNGKIQDQVTNDGRDSRVRGIMEKFKVPHHQANVIYQRERETEIQLVKDGKIPPSVSSRQIRIFPESISPTAPPSKMMIAQLTKEGGRVYERTKPKLYAKPEIRFLMNNVGQGIPTKELTIQFNTLFRTNRTESSIYNKTYRLSRTPSS